MVFRSFSRSFHEIVNEDDCVSPQQTAARMVADKQPGRWNVWCYTPPKDPDATDRQNGDNDFSQKTIVGA